ncbi:MAG: holdfast anchoring protein HfaA [Pseudomonadota bacterium]
MTFTRPPRLSAFAAIAALSAGAAYANPAARYTDEFQRPFGFAYGDESRPFDAGTRDANGNRVIIDGRMVIGDDLSTLSRTDSFSFSGSASGAGYFAPGNAVGNQLNVITQGSNNTVIIDSTQINDGDQTVILNGGLDLND